MTKNMTICESEISELINFVTIRELHKQLFNKPHLDFPVVNTIKPKVPTFLDKVQ